MYGVGDENMVFYAKRLSAPFLLCFQYVTMFLYINVDVAGVCQYIMKTINYYRHTEARDVLCDTKELPANIVLVPKIDDDYY